VPSSVACPFGNARVALAAGFLTGILFFVV